MFVPLRDRFGDFLCCLSGFRRVCMWKHQHVQPLVPFAIIVVLVGTTQLLVPATATAIGASGTEAVASAREILAQLPVESVVYAEGTVRERPDGMHNPDMPTGSCSQI